MVLKQILPRLARRLAASEKRQDMVLLANLLRLAPGKPQTEQLMKGFEEAFRGRAMTSLPEELITAIAASGGASLSVRLRQGDATAIHDALTVVADPKAKLEDRLLYTRILGEVRSAEGVPVLLNLVLSNGDIALRKAALASLSAYDSDDIPTRVLAELPQLPVEAPRCGICVTRQPARVDPDAHRPTSGREGQYDPGAQ
jgi:hypothetical protein